MKSKAVINKFIDSFKLDFTFLKILLFDLIFYAISIPTTLLGGMMLLKKANTIDISAINQEILAKAPETIQPVMEQAQSLFWTIILVFFALFIINLAAWSLSRGLVYTTILKKKFTKKHFLKAMGINFIFGIAAFVIILFFSSIAVVLPSSSFIFLLIFAVISYFLIITYVYFTKTLKVFSSIGDGLSTGMKKLNKLFIPYLLIILVLALLTALLFFINKIISISPYISLIIMAVYLAWARLYFIPEVEKQV